MTQKSLYIFLSALVKDISKDNFHQELTKVCLLNLNIAYFFFIITYLDGALIIILGCFEGKYFYSTAENNS